MSVLLKNTDKPDIGGAGKERLKGNQAEAAGGVRRHIDPAVDLGKLDVCFGGFTPMALSDGPATREQVLLAEQRARERKEALERSSAIEAARASEARDYTDESGTTWRYVVLDETQVRIEGCEPHEGALELAIPGTIEGLPVVALAADACSRLDGVEAITLPPTVISIAYCAFRDCRSLRAIDFPDALATYDTGWTRGCTKLERLKLPGGLETITPGIFDLPALKSLTIGKAACEVMPGACAKSQLEHLEIARENPYLSTDGKAIYSSDRSALLALAVPVTSYTVDSACVAIGRKAFGSFACLEEVNLPPSLELIGDFAFTRAGITTFDAPPALKAIGERAFFACSALEQVTLNSGLLAIGPNAFTDTSLTELRIPATIVELGNPVAAGTGLTYSGKDASFSIQTGDALTSPASGSLSLDEFGGLYRNAEDGVHFVRMLEPSIESYAVAQGTVAIDADAFAKHASIEQVTLPEGLLEIGAGAFKGCRTLTQVNLPATLHEIGDEAFLDTNLESIVIPKALARIGAIALITNGAHHGTCEPSLRHIEVEPGNARYWMESGLLLERLDNGVERVVLCTGEVADVVVPHGVTGIAAYAFNGVRRLRSLTIHERVQAIDVRGLAFDCLLDTIHVDLDQPIEGHLFFEFAFPKTSRAAQQMSLAFGSASFVNVEGIFDHYDNAIVNRNGFDAANEGALGAYEQVKRMVARLEEPLYMSPTNRGLMESALRSHLGEYCLDIARHDDKAAIDGLLDLGFIDASNIADVINVVGAVQDASITNYLLEQKRRRFGTQAIDFDL